MSRRRWITGALIAQLALAVPGIASAQFLRGNIYGVVSDASGGVLPGVTLTLTSPALLQPLSSVSSDTGDYRFPALPPGEYALRADLTGFRTVSRGNIRVAGGGNLQINLVMDLAQVQETVTVTGESPLVDLKSNAVNVTYDDETLESLPTGRDLWSVMESMPGIVASNVNVGGSAVGTPNQVYAYGSQSAENTYELNGVNVNDPSTQGSSFARYDEDSFTEIRVETGAKPPEVRGGGVYISMLTKSGGNSFSGGGSFYGQDDSFSSDNVDDELRSQGVRSSTAVLKNLDYQGQIGGPILKNRIWFYGAGRYQNVDKGVLNFFLPDGSPGNGINKIYSYTGKVTSQVSTKNKFEFYFNRSGRIEPYRNAGPNFAADAVWDEDSFADVYQGTLTTLVNENLFIDFRGGVMLVDFPLTASEFIGPNPVSQVELSTNRRSGAPEQQRHHYRSRYRFDTALTYFRSGWAGTHEFRAGFQFEDGGQEVYQMVFEDVVLQFDRGRPSRAQVWNSPTHYNDRYQDIAFHVNDTWNPSRRVSINAGLRVSFGEAYYPDQSNRDGDKSQFIDIQRPGRFFPDETRLAERREILNWAHPAPRLGITIDPLGDGKSAIRAGYGRYYAQLDSDFADVVNQNLPRFRVVAWNDFNGDRRAQPAELDTTALLAFGDPSGVGLFGDQIDPNTEQPLEDQVMVGYDRQIGDDMSFGVSYQYRRGDRGIGFNNALVPFSGYSPLTIANPLGSGSFQVFNLSRAFRGQLQRVMTNQEGATREYNGVELRFGRRHSAKWALSASLTIGKGEGIATDHFQGFWQDPNLLINRYGADPFDSTYVGRVSGSYVLPYQVNLGVNYRYTSGRPFTPTLRLRGLNQGDVTINTQTPGESRHDAQNLVDIRLEKRFDLGRGGQVGVVFDLFNTFNTNTVFQRNALSGTYDVLTGVFTAGTAYRQIQNILPPRVYRFGVRYAF